MTYQNVTPLRILLALAVVATLAARPADAVNYRYEAELGVRTTGVTIGNSAAASAGKYVTFNTGSSTSAVTVTADVPDGLYEMWLGFRTPNGTKGYNFSVDGVSGSGMFPATNQFSADRAGLFDLTAGMNTMQVGGGWNYYDIDYFEFRPYTPPATLPVAPTLVDEQASYRTRVLMNYLTQQYGHKTLSGQQSTGNSFPGSSYLQKSGGLSPAVRGSDFIEYSPTRLQFGSNPNNESERTITWAQQTGGISTMMWHWNAPDDLINTTGHEWWRGFYTDSTTFDVAAALANPAGDKYAKIIRDIDAISVQLKKFQDADVPVIWRPLHEAQGAWFWWGAKGAGPFKELWNLMYDRMTNYHGLHNLIWEFTSSTDNFASWYPGDDVVDMIGLDIYSTPGDTMSGQWLDMLQEYNGKKMIALSETGTWPDAATMEKWGINWSYFSPWTGSYINNVPAADMQATLGSQKIITLNELPALPWKNGGEFMAGDLDLNGVVDGDDLAVLTAAFGVDARGDVDGDGDTDGEDVVWLQRQLEASPLLAASARAVPEPSAALLAALSLISGARRRTRLL